MYELNPKKWHYSKSFPFQMMICIPSPFSISFFVSLIEYWKILFRTFTLFCLFFSSFMTRHWFSLAHPSKKVICTMSKRLGENGVSLSAFFLLFSLLVVYILFMPTDSMFFLHQQFTFIPHWKWLPNGFRQTNSVYKTTWITSAPTHRKISFIPRDKTKKNNWSTTSCEVALWSFVRW